ncbi:non-canonical purine NTP pyrophosphatase [archaeon]|nr:MAG: non-canonical purine NTP pyrophosphatase [archaeon]
MALACRTLQLRSRGGRTRPGSYAPPRPSHSCVRLRSPLQVAYAKCKSAADEVRGPVLVDDTSLCFNALNGLPGVYIRPFLETVGHDGLNKLLAGYEDKTAYAQCIFAFSEGPGAEPVLFAGRTPVRSSPWRGGTPPASRGYAHALP